MLLELPASVVAQMLYDEALLNKAIERALTALTSSDHRYHCHLTIKQIDFYKTELKMHSNVCKSHKSVCNVVTSHTTYSTV